MTWGVHLLKGKKTARFVGSEGKVLIREIKVAHAEWKAAQDKLNFVLEKDQIDYAIYAVKAAEQRYSMLIRRAKQMNLHMTKKQGERAVES